MATKRTFNEEDHQVNDDRDLQVRAKKRHGDPQQAEATDPSVIIRTAWEVMLPTFRQMMKEQFQFLEAKLQNTCCCRLRQNQECATSGSRPLQLYFENSLPQEMFTLDNLRAEDGRPLQIKLCGPEGLVMEEVGTMNLQICVLDGDFGTDGNEDWTAEEFNSQFVKPRDGKGPLLKGETVIKLEKGVAFINNNIVFTDNSSGTRSKHYRLGVKVKQSNNFVRTDIREARSGPVRVLDRRGKENKKHYRPALDDDVCRLQNIKKRSPLYRQLSDNGIKIVKDLLRFNATGLLREKFPDTKWDKIIAQAEDCKLNDDERYIYHGMENSLSLVFNCIYEVVGVKFSGQNCDRSLKSLSSEEKRLVERVKQVAYRNLKDLVPIETAHHDMANALTDTLVAPYGAPDQGQPVQLSCHSQPFIYASCTNQGVHDPLPSIGEMGQNSHTLGGFNYPEGNSWDLDGSHFPLVQGGCSIENESLDIEFVNDCLPYTTWEPETGFFFGSSHGAEINSSYSTLINSAVDISSTGKPKAWYKIFVALKWVILAKRNAAARKNAQLF